MGRFYHKIVLDGRKYKLMSQLLPFLLVLDILLVYVIETLMFPFFPLLGFSPMVLISRLAIITEDVKEEEDLG